VEEREEGREGKGMEQIRLIGLGLDRGGRGEARAKYGRVHMWATNGGLLINGAIMRCQVWGDVVLARLPPPPDSFFGSLASSRSARRRSPVLPHITAHPSKIITTHTALERLQNKKK
jgi:hypothetical protein